MAMSLSAEFDTRRDAEMAVEHVVQEHGIDRQAVQIAPVSVENTSGVRVAGSDTEEGHKKEGVTGGPLLAGRIRLTVEAEDAATDKILSSFATYGGRRTE